MGRFETWIDRVTSARRLRRRAAAVSAPQRRLRIEQCEPRFALSAAAPLDVAASEHLETSVRVVQTLWDSTPGAAEWGEVTFSVPADIGLEEASHWFSVRSTRAISPSAGFEQGGLIGLDSVLASSNLFAQPATFGFDQGMSRGEVRLDDYILNAGSVVDSDNVGSILIEASPNGFEPSWPETTQPPLDFGDGGLNGAAAGGKASGTDEANVTLIESPVLRITAPLATTSDEGGAIDVTAMVAPRALLAAQNAASLANSGMRASARRLSEAEPSTQRTSIAAGDTDELRARAVVYEVALARELGTEALDETRAEHAPLPASATPAPEAPARTDNPTTALPTAGDATGEIAGHAAIEGRVDVSHQTSQHQQGSADGRGAVVTLGARDAALARFDLDDESNDRPAADLETASSRSQTLGMALALVVGAGPIVRRMRRSKAGREAEPAVGPF